MAARLERHPASGARSISCRCCSTRSRTTPTSSPPASGATRCCASPPRPTRQNCANRPRLAARHGLPLPRPDHARTFAHYRRLRDLLAFVLRPRRQWLNYLSATFCRPRHLVPAGLERRKPARTSGTDRSATDGQGRRLLTGRPPGLLAELGAAVAGLIPRYRALADSGRSTLLYPGQPPAGAAAHRLQSPPARLAGLPAARRARNTGRPLAGRSPPGGGPGQPAAVSGSRQRACGRPKAPCPRPSSSRSAAAGFAWTANSHGVLRHSAGNAPAPPPSPGCPGSTDRAT